MTPLLHALVYAMRYEARDIVSVELRPATPDVVFPSFEAGAHIDLHLQDHLVRSYSLCELDSHGGRYVVSVLNDRASRGGSRYVHERLRVGKTLMISPPRNNFRLHETAENVVLVAGGIGVTPIYAMLQRLRQLGKRPALIYCARSRPEAAFCRPIAELAEERVTWHFDDERDGPPDLEALLAGHDPSTHFYCCGPRPMLDAYERACAELGYPNAHLERFSAEVKPVAVGGEAGPRAFEVELRRSGLTLHVPADRSILKVLLDAGVDLDYSCEEGICGSCETAVIEGDVDHRDSILLSAAERAANASMMVCVSRCTSDRLVLDR